jgi:hypothetical protein
MSERDEKRNLCEMTHHEWKEEYYGLKCETCSVFIPYGSEPWMPYEDDEPTCKHCGKPLYDFSDLGCEYCDRRHPDFGVLP